MLHSNSTMFVIFGIECDVCVAADEFEEAIRDTRLEDEFIPLATCNIWSQRAGFSHKTVVLDSGLAPRPASLCL